MFQMPPRNNTTGTSLIPASDDSRHNEVLAEVTALRKKQESVLTQMAALKKENEMVWMRYSDIEEKFTKQQTILNQVSEKRRVYS